MNTKVIESSIVYPSEETPKGPLWLSSIDQIIRSPYSHTHILFVYKAPDKTDDNEPTFFDTNLLKESLSKALVAFYPMAGRLQENPKTGRIEINCNAKGVTFIEVETTHTLADFGEFEPSPEIKNLFLPKCNYEGGLSSFPLFLVQLTRFKCGGVSLGFLQHHHVADGASHVHFNNSWARLARGLELDVLPFHDRYSCFAPRDPLQIKFQHLEFEPPLPPLPLKGDMVETVQGLFKFTIEQINTLKQLAMSQDDNSYINSTFEVLAAHIWRTACKAREIPNDQEVKLYIPSDGRQRLKDPPLPQGYFGNVYFLAVCKARASDIIHKPLCYAVSKVHQAVKNVKSSEYLRSAIDYLESQPDLNALVRGPHTVTSPNFFINTWVNFPVKQTDFGWGEPTYVCRGELKFEGKSCLMPSHDGDGSISLVLKLYPLHMKAFGKYIYEF